MKVGFFLDVPHYLGGAGTLLLKQARLMREIHEVIVVIPVSDNGIENPYYVKWCEDSGLKHVGLRYKTATTFRDIDLLDALNNITNLVIFLKNESIEFIHSVQLNVALEMASRQLELPHLMNIYQLRKEEFLLKQDFDLFAHFHLCDSILYSNLWKDNLQIESKCLRPLSPTIKISDKKMAKKGSYTIIMLGLLCERKNQLAAIQAVEQLKDYIKVHMIIVGENRNKYGEICRNYVSEHELDRIIEFYGFTQNVKEVLENGDWFLCSSTDESFPSSVVEAVSYGLTVITTPVGGIPEIFVNRNNAFVSRDFSVESISAAISDCFTFCQNGEIDRIQNAAVNTWEEYFSIQSNKEKINNYYKDVIVKNAQISRQKEIEETQIKEIYKAGERFNLCVDENRFLERIFYYSYLIKCVEKEQIKEAYIWGAGQIGKFAHSFLVNALPKIKILGFLDKMKRGEYMGELVYNPDKIKFKKGTLVFIAFAGDYWPCIEQLQDFGLEFGKEIWIIS